MYSVAEVIDQIRSLEGVDVELEIPDNVRFITAYDDFFKERINEEATVGELQLRIQTFVSTQSYLPEP